MEQKGISVVINTYNASKFLREVLESVKRFDEIVVCDMESTDDTVRIAEEYHCRVVTFLRKDCRIVEPARQFAIEQASFSWVLVVDADEVVPDGLRTYLYGVIEREDCPQGIAIPRKNYFMGKFMHCTYPDYILRFFRKDVTVWPPVIHTSPIVSGRVERIPKCRKDLAFEHLANDSVEDILRKNNTYSNYEVSRRRGKNYGLPHLVLKPAFRFFKSYVLKSGWKDGIPGLIYSALTGIYQFMIVAKMMEERKQKPETTERL